MKKFFLSGMITLQVCLLGAQGLSHQALIPASIYKLGQVSDASVSPEGNWVLFSYSKVDSAKDKRGSDLWMVSWDGSQTVQLTHTAESESAPKWSPDGKYISFLSSRMGSSGSQIWLMDRRGGEARKLTNVKGDLGDYQWSPDGQSLLLTIRDPERPDSLKDKTTPPIELDRYHFKQDREGYLKRIQTHLYLYHLEGGKTDTLTRGKYDEGSAVWSPDGKRIAFVSNHDEDPDKSENNDIFVMEAHPGAAIKALTQWTGNDRDPVWSPDGEQIAYLRSSYSGTYTMYEQAQLCVISSQGGEPRVLGAGLDRPVYNPRWSGDGKAVWVLVSDDRQESLGKMDLASGQYSLLQGGKKVFGALETNHHDKWVVLQSSPQNPFEVYALENNSLRQLTHQSDSFRAAYVLTEPEGFSSRSKDGTVVDGIFYPPLGGKAGEKYPLLLYIHGGPVAQDDWSFDLNAQVFAAAGYAVAQVNYRGSNGRGLNYCRAINADWGNKEVQDLLGAVDWLVANKNIDPSRLGIVGWSYGGILTNYCIASDGRFKAAASGAGSSLQLSMYGVDQYVLQYDNELGQPWKNLDKWLKVSYPFTRADRIHTPTLFMAGEKDFNVPSVGAEQMYQALRSLGIPTKLVIYPGQFHGISVPSYQVDRLSRYLEWFGTYLKK